jgi:hypothetical protein
VWVALPGVRVAALEQRERVDEHDLARHGLERRKPYAHGVLLVEAQALARREHLAKRGAHAREHGAGGSPEAGDEVLV